MKLAQALVLYRIQRQIVQRIVQRSTFQLILDSGVATAPSVRKSTSGLSDEEGLKLRGLSAIKRSNRISGLVFLIESPLSSILALW